jgi:hypothetical protein
VNNTPLFPPAERFGLAMIALIRAIAAQAGWFVPRWLVAKVEAEIWGFVEALSLLVAVVREANLAAAAAAAAAEPAPQPVKATEPKPARNRGTAPSGRLLRIARTATDLPEIGGQESAAPLVRPDISHPPNSSPPRSPVTGHRSTGLRPRTVHPALEKWAIPSRNFGAFILLQCRNIKRHRRRAAAFA